MPFRPTYRFIFVVLLPVILLFCGCYQEQVFEVKAGFSAGVLNNNYSVPALVKISNTTTGAEKYLWSMPGAEPASSTERNPGNIQYNKPGTYTIRLEANNQYGGKDSHDTIFTFDSAIRTAFTASNAASWYPEATVHINNNTVGATTYQWTFTDGTPSSSTQQYPGDVVFNTPGAHLITLTAGNGRVSYTKDTTVTVLPDLANDFSLNWAAEDNDMEVPFTACLQSNCVSATSLEWNTAGGSPASSVTATPTVTYTSPGTYTITLKASNDKKSLTKSQTITLYANSNLFRFSNVHLGINTAQNTIGCYFSSTLGKVLKPSEVTNDNGSDIDIAFFGFDSGFGYNKFVSPTSVQNYTFAYIPNAINTFIVNRQENCGCGSSMTVAQFDALSDDTLLQSTDINQTTSGLAEFDNTVLPRVVLFQIQDGRKGAIKIKQFVQAGQQSYIVCDIKVMKKS
jgi:PKD repeat protein